MSNSLHIQTFHCHQHLSSRDIDQLVAMEMQCFKHVCMSEEEHYITQKLRNNPIDVPQRPSTLNNNTEVAVAFNHNKKIELQKRAEACRRSRVNRKVKMIKSIYRHSFMENKFNLTAQYLEYIQSIIDNMEMQLLHQGLVTANYLHNLRTNFKVRDVQVKIN